MKILIFCEIQFIRIQDFCCIFQNEVDFGFGIQVYYTHEVK